MTAPGFSLTSGGAAAFSGTLGVTGNSTFNGSIAGSALSLSSTLSVTGAVVFSNNLSVAGAATFNGATTLTAASITGGTISGLTSFATTGMAIGSTGALQTTGVGSGSVAGNARGTGAVDLQTIRTAATQVASGNYSFVAGSNCTASSTSAIAIGNSASASGTSAIAIGTLAAASSLNAVAIGNGSTANSTNAIALGSSTASAFNSIATGSDAVSRRNGEHTHSSGQASAAGDSQVSTILLNGITATATVTELTNPARIALVNDSTIQFEINVVARRTDADNESAAYELKGCIDRNTTAASTALVGTVTKTVVAEDTAAWDVAVTADTTNGSLKISVTGEASKTIKWVAFCRLVEVQG
ncbi:MAG: hypothetical protein HY785_22180 [Oscillatoriophycideae cyanobacterium NC_groundwater_1537_Pr4_S-0.65um_50_18]|nr:hypothetical protein [Oscillatoriophycideae cyanobacterium NC_groundwater_1537_Pr4_S-0.65um_50_18]